MKRWLCTLLLGCSCYWVDGQTVVIEGTVSDIGSGERLSGVSVQVGRQQGSVTDKDGRFSLLVSDQLLEKHGLKFTYIGYLPQQLKYKPGMRQVEVLMQHTADSLADIVVSPRGLELVKQAVEALPRNLPPEPFVRKIIARTYNTVNDSDYFYMNTAVLESYYRGAAKKPEFPETRLVQSTDTLMLNDTAKDAFLLQNVRWMGAFHVSDFVYGRNPHFDLFNLDQLKFFYPSVQQLDGHTVYVVEFEARKGHKREGRVYIDTASLAFVGLDVTAYDYRKPGVATLNVGISEMRFEKIGNYWYPARHNRNAKYILTGKTQYLVAWQAIDLNTNPRRSFGYGETIKADDENKTMRKPAEDSAWQPYNNTIASMEAADVLPVMITPVQPVISAADTARAPVVYKLSFAQRLGSYLTGPSVNALFGLQSAPVRALSAPPDGAPDVSNAIMAQYLIAFRFQTIKHTYAWVQMGSNFGIGGTRSASTIWGLSYDLLFNKRHRPMTLAPMVGYHTQRLRNKDADLKLKERGWVAGLQYRVEQNRSKSWFVQGLYHFGQQDTDALKLLAAQPIRYSVGVGLFIR